MMIHISKKQKSDLVKVLIKAAVELDLQEDRELAEKLVREIKW